MQCRRLETLDLDDNLAAAGRPDTQMDAAAQLRSAPIGRRRTGAASGEIRWFRYGRLGQCHELLSLVRDAHAGARVHAATSRFAYEPLSCAPGRLTVPAVILSSPRVSDGTRSGSGIVVVDRTTPQMAVAI